MYIYAGKHPKISCAVNHFASRTIKMCSVLPSFFFPFYMKTTEEIFWWFLATEYKQKAQTNCIH